MADLRSVLNLVPQFALFPPGIVPLILDYDDGLPQTKRDFRHFVSQHSWYKHLSLDNSKNNWFYLLPALNPQPGNPGQQERSDDGKVHWYFVPFWAWREHARITKDGTVDKKILQICEAHPVPLNPWMHRKSRWTEDLLRDSRDGVWPNSLPPRFDIILDDCKATIESWLVRHGHSDALEFWRLHRGSDRMHKREGNPFVALHVSEYKRMEALVFKTASTVWGNLIAAGFTYSDLAAPFRWRRL